MQTKIIPNHNTHTYQEVLEYEIKTALNRLLSKGVPKDRVYISYDIVRVYTTFEEHENKSYRRFTPMYAEKVNGIISFYLEYPLKGFSAYKAKNMANFYYYYTGENNAN